MNPEKVAIVVQARMSSTRLPGKTLEPLAGAPAIVRMMQRLEPVDDAAWHIVATSDESTDDAIERVGRQNGISVTRGPLQDVLGRICRAVPSGVETIVRLTADCPLVDPSLVRDHIQAFDRCSPEVDIVTNSQRRTHPDGLDVEVVRRSALEEANREAVEPADREHVLPWVYRRGRVQHIRQATDLSALRWTLDTPRDYDNIAAIYDHLYSANARFTSADVYRLLAENPRLIQVAHDRGIDDAERAEWVSRIASHLALVETAA